MNTNEISKNGSNTIKFIIISILIIAVISLIGVAYARYITRLNGQVTADIANYNFNVTVGNNTNLNINLANTRLANDTARVQSGYVAPDTKGAFNLNINATGSNTTLIYNLDLDLTNVPENLKFYSDSNMKNEIMVQDNKIKIEDCIGLNDTKTKTITLYWQWPFETGENDYEISLNDAKDSRWLGHDIEIAVNATSRQVLEKVTYLADSVQIGDYVNYDATSGDGAGLTITPTSDLTGSNTTTTFNSSDITGWRVYDVDSVTKTVTLIAEEPTVQTLNLVTAIGWINAENVLNLVGEIYGHGIGAYEGRSIQEKDILKYSPSYNPANYKNNEHQTNGINDGYYYYTGASNRIETETYTSGTFILDDNTIVEATTKNPVTMKQTHYGFLAKSVIKDATVRSMLVLETGNTENYKRNYWLAKRVTYLTPTGCKYYVKVINNGAIDQYLTLYNSSYSNQNPSWAVMPMVTLQSNIQVTGKDSNNVWQLNVE